MGYKSKSVPLHVKEGVKEYDIHIELKSYKLKLLKKLVVQQTYPKIKPIPYHFSKCMKDISEDSRYIIDLENI